MQKTELPGGRHYNANPNGITNVRPTVDAEAFDFATTRLRVALANARNEVSVALLDIPRDSRAHGILVETMAKLDRAWDASIARDLPVVARAFNLPSAKVTK